MTSDETNDENDFDLYDHLSQYSYDGPELFLEIIEELDKARDLLWYIRNEQASNPTDADTERRKRIDRELPAELAHWTSCDCEDCRIDNENRLAGAAGAFEMVMSKLLDVSQNTSDQINYDLGDEDEE